MLIAHETGAVTHFPHNFNHLDPADLFFVAKQVVGFILGNPNAHHPPAGVDIVFTFKPQKEYGGSLITLYYSKNNKAAKRTFKKHNKKSKAVAAFTYADLTGDATGSTYDVEVSR